VSKVSNDGAIGGYFGLESVVGSGLSWIDDTIGYQSARSALAAILEVIRPENVWVPNYICGAVNDTLKSVAKNVQRYSLTDALGVPDSLRLGPADLLICVDYFGMNADAVNRAIDRLGVERTLVDASQSLFFRHRAGSTTIYSPRKFFGVPDGGLLQASRRPPVPHEAIEAESMMRSQHLLYRFAGLIDAGYKKFREAEASLSGCAPVAMSRLTGALLSSIDVNAAAERRVGNYLHLSTLLRAAGLEVPRLSFDAVPLCCPVRCNNAHYVRNELAARRIYTPTYWSDAIIPDDDLIALRLRDKTVYLPCDQRYEEHDLFRVANSIIEITEAS
jgi:hypothetical protein